jgi:hypothetical protein
MVPDVLKDFCAFIMLGTTHPVTECHIQGNLNPAVRTSYLVLRTNLCPLDYMNAAHKLISDGKNRMRLMSE